MKSLMMVMAFQYLNVPYVWSGNDANGFDCSGFVLKVLRDIGYELPDMTSQSLFNRCLNESNKSSLECDSLLFFGKNKSNITHVAISIGEIEGVPLMIEAGGAGRESKTKAKDELLALDARVRIKPISNRGDLIAGYKIPFKERL